MNFSKTIKAFFSLLAFIGFVLGFISCGLSETVSFGVMLKLGAAAIMLMLPFLLTCEMW